ncbi:myosin light chain kinase 3-like [Hydra vulgaris]|uniref:Myosin light chain kinase 3-like n=1 Tax=Hydra vulgaris TaxID=6087 RepID=A0ABM4DDK9_HYDVU
MSMKKADDDEESTLVLSKEIPSMPYSEIFYDRFEPVVDDNIDFTNYDVTLLQHEVPDDDIKTLTLASPVASDTTDHDCPSMLLVNPSQGLHDILVHKYIAGFDENTDCRNRVECENIILQTLEKISEKCVQDDNFEKIKEKIEYAFNECPKKCTNGHFKCEEIKKHVVQKVYSNINGNEENSMKTLIFNHSLSCKCAANCKVPKCGSIKRNLKRRLKPNLKTEPVFDSSQQLHIMFSNVNTFSVGTFIQINHDLVSVFEKQISKGHFGAVCDCWIICNKYRGGAQVAVKKIKEAESIKATAKSMALLSTIGESTNIVIPLLVLETTNNPKICYQIMILAEMDLKFVVNNGPITENLIAYLIKDVLNGIWYLHRRGYVHCDLKLENIVVKDYSALICDIDFVKKEKAKCEVATPNFSAPEIYDGVANKPIDIHSVGLIIASMANVDISTKINRDDPPQEKKRKINKRNKIVSNEIKRTHDKFSQVFNDCTEEDPSKRPTVDNLVNNSLFQVDVETVSNEINCIRSKKSSESNNFGIQDDLADSIVQLHLNQILDKLPKKFLENEHFYHGNCVDLKK